MIGWINLSVESFVKECFGEEAWLAILEKTQHDSKWVSSCPYPDKITYDLVLTGAELLGVTPAQALEAYGEYFIGYVTSQGYDRVLLTLGSNVAQFLMNLNNLHLHLSIGMPAMSPPAFRVTDVTPESLKLHYYSKRPALWPIVKGAIQAMANVHFKFDVSLQLLQSRDDGCDHEVFLVSYPFQQDLVDFSLEEAGKESVFTIDNRNFFKFFPFHILMDRKLNVIQVGNVLERLFPETADGSDFSTFFEVKHPYVALDFNSIMEADNNVFLLRSKRTGLELKGAIIQVPFTEATAPKLAGAEGGSGLLFMGSPRMSSLEEMKKMGLFLSDIPLHDIARDFTLLAEQRMAEANLKERFEKLNQQLKHTTKELVEERARSDRLLHQMLPPEVADSLRHGNTVDAKPYPEVTILFSDIVNFSVIARKSTPHEVCVMLNELYNRFDALCDLPEFKPCYKVETIGDAYMMVANLENPCEEHADLALRFAAAMHNCARRVHIHGMQLTIRVGIHSGATVGAVVGRRMPRFTLFGDTVNTASRMESHSEPGKIHMSGATFSLLKDPAQFVIRPRGEINVKGLGAMHTYFMDRLVEWKPEYDAAAGEKVFLGRPDEVDLWHEFKLEAERSGASGPAGRRRRSSIEIGSEEAAAHLPRSTSVDSAGESFAAAPAGHEDESGLPCIKDGKVII